MREHLASLVEEFRRYSTETAVVAHRGIRRYTTTYGELASLAGRFAAELERRSVAPGDRVVLWADNSAEWIAVFFGCLLRAAIVVPLDAAGAGDFAARVIRDVAPKLVLGDPRLLATLQNDDRRNGTGNKERQAARAADEAISQLPDRLPLADIGAHLPAGPLFTVSDAVHAETPFQIVFTSGTTSEPRGIVHTHRNILATLQPIENEIAKYRRYERWIHPLRFLHSIPLSHVFGQFMGLWCPALLAAEVHFVEQPDPTRIVDLIRRERISVLVAVPRVLHLLRAHLFGRFPTLAAQLNAASGLSIGRRWWLFRRVHSALGWKFWAVISGGATLAADLESFWNGLGFALIQGYGMTETAALVTLNHPFHIAPGTIGKPLPGREVMIADDGEILVRGAMLAKTTWFAGAMRPRQGEWLATGDLAEKNASGELRFLGRKSEVIVTAAGMNIHPADLEAALAAQHGVRGAVVVSCEIAGGAEPAAVVLFAGTDDRLQATVANANRALAEYQRIRRVLRWPEPEFPYTSTGKLLRRQVAQWASETLSDHRQSDAPTIVATRDALLDLIAEVTGEAVPSATPAALNRLRLSEDLRLDSLGRVQLQSSLELRFALDLQDDALATIKTVGDLRALMEACRSGPTSQNSRTSPALPPDATPRADAPSLASERRESNPQLPTPPAADAQPSTGTLQPEAHLYPRWPWIWPIQAVRVVFLELIARPLVWLLAAPRVVYTASLEDRAMNCTPLLIVANHVTAYDGALILYALPFRLRHRVAAAMSGEMLLDMRHARNQPNRLANLLAPVAYWLLTALFNVFPMPRARGFRRSFAHAGEAMDRSYSILLFAEGTRSRDGALHPFRPGIGLLAQQSRVPVLPIALVGLYELTATTASVSVP